MRILEKLPGYLRHFNIKANQEVEFPAVEYKAARQSLPALEMMVLYPTSRKKRTNQMRQIAFYVLSVKVDLASVGQQLTIVTNKGLPSSDRKTKSTQTREL
jgi:hypothetical protein